MGYAVRLVKPQALAFGCAEMQLRRLKADVGSGINMYRVMMY
jgi:hypothetical protein